MQYLRADVANTVTIGPAVAVGDGFVPVTNLVGGSADEYEVIKHGATATLGISAALSAISGADGYYSLVLSSSECDTEGRFMLLINDDDLILPIKHEFHVLSQQVFDSMILGTDLLDTQVAGMDANVVTATAINAAALTTAKFAGDFIDSTLIADNAIRVEHIGANAITSAKLATDCIGATQLQTGFITSGAFAIAAIQAAAINTDTITASKVATDLIDEIRDGILDELTTNHQTAGTVGLTIHNLPNDGALTDLAPSATAFDPATDDVDVRGIQANVITATSISGNAITSAKIAGSAIGSTQIGLSAINAAKFAADSFSAAALSTAAVDKIRDGILDELTTNHTSAGTVGLTLDNLPNDGALTNLDAAITTRATPAQVATELGTYDGPTEAEMNLRTILSASYFDPAVDDVDVRSLQANVITAASINAAAIVAAKFGAGGIDAAALNADAVDKIRDGILPTQNAAFSNLMFLFVDSTDHVTPVTSASTISGTRSIDGGAFTGVAGSIAEIGNGIYQFDALAADMDGGIITFRFIATGGTPNAPDDAFVTIVTGGGV